MPAFARSLPYTNRPIINITPLPEWVSRRDERMRLLMYLLQGNFRESPQETHFWNNRLLTQEERLALDRYRMVSFAADTTACAPWCWKVVPRFHMPIFGGWRIFAVIRPQLVLDQTWYVGWLSGATAGISLLPIKGNVRVLLPPTPTKFFGVDAEGQQVSVYSSDIGKIGEAGKFAGLPLR